ncbi:TIGR03086 family metal-binding protein [Amycolatopsis sp. H20-H5]|uniref:TIGR03086 family metal-binding protein n=1 Tax=Amycolatopsis sp. H20-H5 TaxID=3046309 RepID=UPI002DBC2EC1|nr:TIGR03086 family metal-binding protein [Amycolatopsis sp. H20-H5]MEC3982202.1 TIGR03086 family metal-binding protein [Amycolatopsis sp. H20-H5]
MPELATQLRVAAAEFTALVCTLGPADLTARTPCDGYDVRGLVNHLLYWGPWLDAAGRKQDAPVAAAGERETDLVGDDWAAALEKQTEGLVDVFARPEAWEGMTLLGGTELPASVVGEMVLGEFVLHGWDLATATGRQLPCVPEVAEALYASVIRMGDQARAMGVYGPEVPVSPEAPLLARVLGAAGRDPGWGSRVS